MKKIFISFMLVSATQTMASLNYKVAVISCLDANNKEAILIKERFVHHGENRDSYTLSRVDRPSQALYVSWIGETLEIKNNERSLEIIGTQKHVLDTGGNVAIPNNLYRADIRTFSLDKLKRSAIFDRKFVERTLFRTTIKEHNVERLHSCVENIDTPTLHF